MKSVLHVLVVVSTIVMLIAQFITVPHAFNSELTFVFYGAVVGSLFRAPPKTSHHPPAASFRFVLRLLLGKLEIIPLNGVPKTLPGYAAFAMIIQRAEFAGKTRRAVQ